MIAILVAAGAVAYAPPTMLAAFLGGTLLLFAASLGTYRVTTLGASLVLVSAAVLVLPANAIRPVPRASLADLLILVAGFMAVAAIIVRPKLLPDIPAWVFLGAGLIICAAAVAESAPVLHPYSRIFQVRNLGTGVQDVGTNLSNVAELLFAAVVTPIVVAITATSWRRVRILAAAWTVGASLSALVAVLAAFTPIDLQGTITGRSYAIVGTTFGEASRFTGLTVHATTLGLASAMAVPLVLTHIGHRNRVIGLAHSATALILILAILLSGSRAAVPAVIIGIIYLFVVLPHLRKALVSVGVAGILVAYSRASELTHLSVIERFTGAASGRSSDVAHASTVHDAVTLWGQSPFVGWGFQTMRGAHNILLQMLVAGGPLAFAGFATLVGGAWATASSLTKAPDIPDDIRHLTYALSASLLVWLTAAVAQSTSSDRYLYLPSAMILAILFVRQHTQASP